jgi:PDZ domain
MPRLPSSYLPLIAGCCVACTSVALAWCRADVPVSASAEIDQLIQQLGSESFQVREAATRKLMEREDAAPALRRALKSPDAEVARRAAEILDVLTTRQNQRALEEAAKNGEIDRAVELLVRRKNWDYPRSCQVLAELAGKLLDLEQQTFAVTSVQITDKVPARDFQRYAARVRPQIIVDERPCFQREAVGDVVVVGEDVSLERTSVASLFVASGRIRASTLINGVVFACGPVELDRMVNSIIVCDSEVTLHGDWDDCLIIARGTVRCSRPIGNCRIATSSHAEARNQTLLGSSKIQDNEPTPLGFVRFFDPARAGIAVEPAEKGVQVKVSTPGKPFARAGLRAGDVVVALSGEEVNSFESFRRLLRAQLAVEEEGVFKVRRDGQTLEIKVRYQD